VRTPLLFLPWPRKKPDDVDVANQHSETILATCQRLRGKRFLHFEEKSLTTLYGCTFQKSLRTRLQPPPLSAALPCLVLLADSFNRQVPMCNRLPDARRTTILSQEDTIHIVHVHVHVHGTQTRGRTTSPRSTALHRTAHFGRQHAYIRIDRIEAAKHGNHTLLAHSEEIPPHPPTSLPSPSPSSATTLPRLTRLRSTQKGTHQDVAEPTLSGAFCVSPTVVQSDHHGARPRPSLPLRDTASLSFLLPTPRGRPAPQQKREHHTRAKRRLFPPKEGKTSGGWHRSGRAGRRGVVTRSVPAGQPSSAVDISSHVIRV